MSVRIVVFVLSLCCFKINCEMRLDPLVYTKAGLLRGLRSENGGYSMFLGVPYGIVDETNPFGPSSPHPGFVEPYNAYTDEFVCPQSSSVSTIGNIQCLRMNIFVPDEATSANKLPVMVWIHGGAFVEGSGNRASTSPDFLVNKGVIVVTLQYRVGVYGFLCLDTPEVPGNQGLKDQVLGLKWIHENIDAFGGDETRITIFGNSAGAMSVNLHILTHGNYFQRAIIQSGPALSPWMFSDANQSIPFDIAVSLGHDAADLDDAMAFLSKEDPLTVVKKAFDLYITNSEETYQPFTKVCVEKQFESVENFLVDHPFNLKSTKIKSIPVIIGFNDNELAFQYGNAPKEWYEDYSYKKMLETNMENIDADIVEVLQHFYTGDEVLGDDVREEITDFASDYIFNYPTERMIQNFLLDGAKNVYHYVFSYVGKRNILKLLLNLKTKGASHADELGYVFEMDLLKNLGDEEDMKMVKVITTLWTNFAKYGNPTLETSDLIPFLWTPVTATTRPYMSLNADLKMEQRPFAKRLSFWHLFYRINKDNLKMFKSNN